MSKLEIAGGGDGGAGGAWISKLLNVDAETKQLKNEYCAVVLAL